MKNQTDFSKMVETGVDRRLSRLEKHSRWSFFNGKITSVNLSSFLFQNQSTGFQ